MSRHNITKPVGWHRFGIKAGWVAAFMVPAWIIAVRMLLGAESTAARIIVSVLPAFLCVLSVISLAVFRRSSTAPTRRVVVALWLAFGCGLLLGAFMPDSTVFATGAEQGQPEALVSVIFGANFDGAASAISNPLAIIMMLSVIVATFFAVLDSRPEGPQRTESEDEFQGTGHFPMMEH